MIGIFDSGFGGLSVYLPLKKLLPKEQFLYFADQDFAPYGEKSKQEITERLKKITSYFELQGVKMIVLACNTATLNAISELREAYPKIKFVGMVPAVKPAAKEVDKIIVLGTRSTVENSVYHKLVYDHANGKQIWHIPAPELVRQVEDGNLLDTSQVEKKILEPLKKGAEGLVIGCSHFSFLKDAIQKKWPDLRIFDGADGVVRQAVSIYNELNLHPWGVENDVFVTTGIPKIVDFVEPKIQFNKIEL